MQGLKIIFPNYLERLTGRATWKQLACVFNTEQMCPLSQSKVFRICEVPEREKSLHLLQPQELVPDYDHFRLQLTNNYIMLFSSRWVIFNYFHGPNEFPAHRKLASLGLDLILTIFLTFCMHPNPMHTMSTKAYWRCCEGKWVQREVVAVRRKSSMLFCPPSFVCS